MKKKTSKKLPDLKLVPGGKACDSRPDWNSFRHILESKAKYKGGPNNVARLLAERMKGMVGGDKRKPFISSFVSEVFLHGIEAKARPGNQHITLKEHTFLLNAAMKGLKRSIVADEKYLFSKERVKSKKYQKSLERKIAEDSELLNALTEKKKLVLDSGKKLAWLFDKTLLGLAKGYSRQRIESLVGHANADRIIVLISEIF